MRSLVSRPEIRFEFRTDDCRDLSHSFLRPLFFLHKWYHATSGWHCASNQRDLIFLDLIASEHFSDAVFCNRSLQGMPR